MSSELADLLPVFLAEATGRLERLNHLLPTLETSPENRREAQRELHTLKGAGRMLQLASFAELCHQLEELVAKGGEGWQQALQRGLDQLAEALAQLKVGPSTPAREEEKPAPRGGDVLRLAGRDLDLLADRATRLRILARGARIFHERLRELSNLAAKAVHEEEPAQALAVLATALRKLALELELGQGRLQRLADAHQDHAVSLQLQPLGPVLQSLARHARQLAGELGKDLAVTVRGEDVKLDRRITRELEEALIHLVRNAVDHGLEKAEQRAALGKNPTGRLLVQASLAGDKVQLVVEDDGCGIDAALVREKAQAQGLISPQEAQAMSAAEALRLLFIPGFSTREHATALSGRGVGMDAVAAACARVGGEVSLTSTVGLGTRVVLTLPAARRGEQVLVVQVGKLQVLYPKAALRRYLPLAEQHVVQRAGRTFCKLEGRLVPFVPLVRLFGQTPAPRQLLLFGEAGGQELAVAVDTVLGEEEVVVRSAPASVSLPSLFAGVAVTSSGKPLGLLAPQALRYATLAAAKAAARVREAEPIKVLLVDDSLVTREMERRLLADAGFAVRVASDGEEALSLLAEQPVDCLVTDIEMPGMDGLELTRRLRQLPQFAHLPVIVVSTRDRPEDRLAGLSAGADAYLAKQGLDASELISLVRRLGGRA